MITGGGGGRAGPGAQVYWLFPKHSPEHLFPQKTREPHGSGLILFSNGNVSPSSFPNCLLTGLTSIDYKS